MTDPITPERRAQIRAIAARYRHRAYIGLEAMAQGIDELDTEIERLNEERDQHAYQSRMDLQTAMKYRQERENIQAILKRTYDELTAAELRIAELEQP